MNSPLEIREGPPARTAWQPPSHGAGIADRQDAVVVSAQADSVQS
jgi:hypothetical protein